MTKRSGNNNNNNTAVNKGLQRTRHDGGHECSEHEEEHAEEEATRVVVRLARLVTNAQVKQTNHNADRQVRYETQARQSLENAKINRHQRALFYV